MSTGKIGTHMVMKTSLRRAKRLRKQRAQEEKRWKSLNGPVIVRKLDTQES